MGGQCEATRQSDFILGARAGQVTVETTSTSAASLDLRTCGVTPQNMENENARTQGLVGCYVDLVAVGQNVFYNLGPTQASVTGANAPSASATGVNGAQCADIIPAGTRVSIKLCEGSDIWLGYVAAGAGTLIIRQSSPK